MKTVLKAIWNVLKSNLVMKITAVLFAVILWSYVISETNPDRTRVIPDVPVLWEVSQLNDKNLAISESLSDVLNTCNVKIVVKQSDLNYLDKNSINAYVDLSIINGVGDYELTVNATPNGITGQVLEVSPSKIKVHVDDYVSKTVPVVVNTIGSVPSGYYANIPEISPTTIEVKGARTDVAKVASAVCNVDLTGLTEGFNKNMEIDLLDYEGNMIDKDLFPSELPAVIVKLDVLPMKTVSIDIDGSIIGQDEVASSYEVADISCEPKTVDIAGDAVAGINKIDLVPYSVSGKSASESVALEYAPPEGVTVLTTQKAQVYITIREITKTKTYSDVSIKTKNLASGLQAKFSEPKMDVTVTAGTSAMSKLSRAAIVPYVDVDGLEAGTYSLDVLFEIPNGFAEENFSASTGAVTVTIY